jgi:hypothetical protein
MRVDVTQEDIEEGARGDCNFCPVARAIRRAFPTKSVFVGANTIGVGGERLEMPDDVDEFVCAFDSYCDVYPFSFELPEVP